MCDKSDAVHEVSGAEICARVIKLEEDVVKLEHRFAANLLKSRLPP